MEDLKLQFIIVMGGLEGPVPHGGLERPVYHRELEVTVCHGGLGGSVCYRGLEVTVCHGGLKIQSVMEDLEVQSIMEDLEVLHLGGKVTQRELEVAHHIIPTVAVKPRGISTGISSLSPFYTLRIPA